MEKEQIVTELLACAEQNGLLPTLDAIFGKRVSVSIPFGQKTLSMGIDELDFSVRSSNALKRTGLMKVEEIVDAISEDRLMQVRNLGKKSYNEIQTRLLLLGFEKLTAAEKREFFRDMLLRNA